jgi:predicted CopG family antitoxin
MHSARMATKTISLHLDAYERLRAARRSPGESFTQVILRARWPEETVTGRALLERLRAAGPHFSEAALDRIERLKGEDQEPEDKWRAD